MNDITFSTTAWEHYLSWQQLDRKTLKKINDLLKDIQRNGPMEGTGKPETLKYRKAWSRRIDHANRLVYRFHEDNKNVFVISCKGHYGD
ncbi:MAG: Txe/YoeB family addiction module toxin [Oscillospiraceae bacterium]|nr:Txe/YoeB family addiction module toxin [Oscillospiraceae bacterium]